MKTSMYLIIRWFVLNFQREFGIQVAISQPEMAGRLARLLDNETSSSYVDLNCGCPIDLLCNQGCGASMMTRPGRLVEVANALARNLPSRSVTVKIRTGF